MSDRRKEVKPQGMKKNSGNCLTILIKRRKHIRTRKPDKRLQDKPAPSTL